MTTSPDIQRGLLYAAMMTNSEDRQEGVTADAVDLIRRHDVARRAIAHFLDYIGGAMHPCRTAPIPAWIMMAPMVDGVGMMPAAKVALLAEHVRRADPIPPPVGLNMRTTA